MSFAPLVVILLAMLVVAREGGAGHEISFYPSFYPQEIKIDVMEPAAAARLLQKKSLHAYVGTDPFATAAAPAHVGYAESLRSFVVLSFSRSATAFPDGASRCRAAAKLLKTLTRSTAIATIHPYPVTTYHEDYLYHADLVDSLKRRYQGLADQSVAPPAATVKAHGPIAESLRAARWRVVERDGDATIDEVAVEDFLKPWAARLDGIGGPPWMKQGWFHAYLLHAGALANAATRGAAEELFERRTSGRYQGRAERINLERRLVSLLTHDCERVVIGYRVAHEALNVEYSDGIENVAYDAQSGLDAGVFVRTAKLKDFPWNGWLRIGLQGRPTAAWNPVAGFSDDGGRLIWAAVGDPALLPSPRSGGWIANRVRALSVTDGVGGALEIPADALAPDGGGGALRPVGRGTSARAKLVYRVLASAFHDETRMTVADVLYPFVFAYRWSARDARNPNRYDPAVDRATATMREWLAAVKVVKTETEVRDLGELQLMYDVFHVEVYLKLPADLDTVAAIAPPWGSVPWQLVVLMEEGVARGLAAFSAAEAKRRGVPWLDLARDRKLRDSLASLIDGFERRAWIPEPLRGLVTVDQARQRWAALKRFGRRHGHLLVTNGPYRLARWSTESVVLDVFRDLTYPLGVGTFDQYAVPLKAYVTRWERRGDRLELAAEVERVVKFERSYKIEREPLRAVAAAEGRRDTPTAHYMILDAADHVVAAGASEDMEAGKIVIDLSRLAPTAAHRALVALALHGNRVHPEITVIPLRGAN